MAEITDQAYQDLKKYIVENWTSIELRDEAGGTIKSLDTTDNNVNWIHPTKTVTVGYDSYMNPIPGEVPDSQRLQLEVVVTGADVSTLPTTFAQSVVKNDSGDELSVETFEPFTMQTEEDEITVVHSIEVPQVV